MDAENYPCGPINQDGDFCVDDVNDLSEHYGPHIYAENFAENLLEDNNDNENPEVITHHTSLLMLPTYQGTVMTQVRGATKAKSLLAKPDLRVFVIRKDLFPLSTARQKSTILASHGSHQRYYGT